MKSRIITGLLALLAAASIASCGDSAVPAPTETQAQKTDPAQTDAETEEAKEPSLYDLLETKDMGNMTYTIFDCNAYPDMHINMPGEELTGELVNDGLINRDTAVEDRFNVNIAYYQENNISKLKKAVQAGDAAYDLVVSDMGNLSGSATGGTLFDLRSIEAVDLTEKCWYPVMAEALTLKGATYFTACDIAPALYQSPCCMFLNLKLYSDYDIDTDIYQLVLDGKWTIDALEKITHDMDVDVNGNGKWDNDDDFFGIGMQPSSETMCSFLSGAAVTLCTISDDGESLVFDAIDNPKTFAACDMIKKIARDIPYVDIQDVIKKTFMENRALFLQHKLQSAAVELRDMEADYLILPDPKFDEAQERYLSAVSIYVCGFTGVPATIDPETSGFITEALARYSGEYLRPVAFDLVYKEKDTRDPRSADVLDVLFDNLYIDFTSVYNFGAVNDALTMVLFKDKEFVSTLEKRRSAADKAIARIVDAWNAD